MILGEMLVTGTVAYSPWFERFGNGATFSGEVFSQSSADVEVEVVVQTKNMQDADALATPVTPVGPLSGSWTLDATGVGSARYVGLLELVRFQYTVQYGTTPPPEDPGFIHFRMLPPMWEDNELTCSAREELQRQHSELAFQ